MTMAVGIICKDGVLVGADRQITGYSYTFPECKINGLSWANGKGIFAYSGERDINQQFWRTVSSAFSHTAMIDPKDVPDIWKECLESLGLKKNQTFLTLFGFMSDGLDYPRLFLSNTDRRVIPVDLAEVIGAGDSSLARCLLGRFRSVCSVLLTVEQAKLYVVDFISQAKKYDGQFVGGPIDVWAASKHGITLLAGGASDTMENQTALAHYWMDVFYRELSDSKGEMINLGLFMQRMQEFRTWLGGGRIPWPKQSDSQT